jgi:hypothetical protein
VRVALQVLDDELDDDQLDEATGRLSRLVRELDVDDIRRGSGGSAPAGAKGSATDIATLLVGLSDSRALSAVVGTVRGWLGVSRGSRRVRLSVDGDELEVDGLSSEEQKDLIRSWLHRHKDG